MNINTVEVREFIPSEGMHLKNILTGEIYEGSIFPAKSLTENDFEEVTEQEYRDYLKAQEPYEESEE